MPHLPTHTRDTAPEASHEGLDATRSKYGFIPNIFGVLSGSPATIGGYIAMSNLLAKSNLSPLEQQVVFLKEFSVIHALLLKTLPPSRPS